MSATEVNLDRLMRRLHAFVAFALVLFAAVPHNVRAQSGGFLFGQPRVSVTVRTGYTIANAHSDLFSFTTDQLTLNRSDFSSASGGADVSLRLRPTTHAVFSFSVSNASTRSEFRDFVDNNELPIEQTTSFTRVPFTVGIRQYLTPTGRSIGRFAWIPTRIAPYVGAGGGAMYYRFKQSGDFIDFQTMDVFSSQMVSHGWARTMHALAGADYSFNARFALTAEARYQWANAPLSQDFTGFDRVDLSGLATTAGLTIRF